MAPAGIFLKRVFTYADVSTLAPRPESAGGGGASVGGGGGAGAAATVVC